MHPEAVARIAAVVEADATAVREATQVERLMSAPEDIHRLIGKLLADLDALEAALALSPQEWSAQDEPGSAPIERARARRERATILLSSSR